MSNPELIGCELTWRRDGADWILQHKRRRMGRVVLDTEHPRMYRVALSRGRLSDMANLSWAKDAAVAAATRELQWEARPSVRKQPLEMPIKVVVFSDQSLRDSFIAWAARVVALSSNANPGAS